MSVIKKCDVEDYRAARRRGKSRQYAQASEAQFKVEASEIPLRKVDPGEPDLIARRSAFRLSKQPASIGQENLPIVVASDSGNVVVHAISKSAHA